MSLTDLQAKAAREIVAFARLENLRAEHHLPEVMLAERLGISRSPIKAALKHLQRLGVVAHDPNRGFFLKQHASDLDSVARKFASRPDDPLYLRIVNDRQDGKLRDEVSEAELMRRYGVTRSGLLRALSRIQKEGWIERKPGNGWHFLPMIDSPAAYEESYLFRQTVEPAGLLSATFKADPAELKELRRRQEFIAGGGFQTMTPIELFEANSVFHETLAAWSGNRFIVQAVQRVDRLRRLVEYRQAAARAPRRTQAGEHLLILDAIERGDMLAAATLMREHLDGARRGKIQEQGVFSTKTQR
jgi:DNA-binding GntR family transcriptional regulator